MSFYLTLPSHSNKAEFSNNANNSFKIRLPQPLILLDLAGALDLFPCRYLTSKSSF